MAHFYCLAKSRHKCIYKVYMIQSIHMYICISVRIPKVMHLNGKRVPGSWGIEGKQDVLGLGLGYVPCPGAIKLIMPL